MTRTHKETTAVQSSYVDENTKNTTSQMVLYIAVVNSILEHMENIIQILTQSLRPMNVHNPQLTGKTYANATNGPNNSLANTNEWPTIATAIATKGPTPGDQSINTANKVVSVEMEERRNIEAKKLNLVFQGVAEDNTGTSDIDKVKAIVSKTMSLKPEITSAERIGRKTNENSTQERSEEN